MYPSDATTATMRGKWLTEKETAKLVALSIHTLRAHRQRHVGIPYIKIGRAVRYAFSDVTAFMAEHRISFGVSPGIR